MYIILYLLGVFAATEICGYKWYPPCLSMSYDALRRPVWKSSSHGGQNGLAAGQQAIDQSLAPDLGISNDLGKPSGIDGSFSSI